MLSLFNEAIDLYEYVFEEIHVPVTFDYFHHKFNTGGLSEETALRLARDTWLYHGVTQYAHYSESRRNEYQKYLLEVCNQHDIEFDQLSEWPSFEKQYNEFGKIRKQAHSDYINEFPNTYDIEDIDIEIEAKAKEQSLLRLYL